MNKSKTLFISIYVNKSLSIIFSAIMFRAERCTLVNEIRWKLENGQFHPVTGDKWSLPLRSVLKFVSALPNNALQKLKVPKVIVASLAGLNRIVVTGLQLGSYVKNSSNVCKSVRLYPISPYRHHLQWLAFDFNVYGRNTFLKHQFLRHLKLGH